MSETGADGPLLIWDESLAEYDLGPGHPLTWEPREPLRILFVGNSYTYTNDVPGMVGNMARDEGFCSPMSWLPVR